MSEAVTAPAEHLLSTNAWPRQLLVVLGLVVLADWLFYGHAIGVSALLFLLALAAAVIVASPPQRMREFLLALGVLAAALVPLAVEISPLSVLFGVLGTAYFALAATPTGTRWRARLYECALLLFDGCWQATFDIIHAARMSTSGDAATQRLGALVVWTMPLALGAIFILLFAAANPLIEGWLTALDFRSQAGRINPGRVAFWAIALSLVWPFVFMRDRRRLRERAEAEVRAVCVGIPDASTPGYLFGKAAILRSLIVFNALFAVQTGLDAAYLWGGATLPDGMTYATYAHRGAYPLIVTALMAAAFVILATRPGSEAERTPLIRALVFLWVAQNVLLVISSILRLDLYVQFYALTYWRVAAFIWMLLVAAGLLLIVARIVLARSNSWLVGMNLGAAALALYACCFINMPQLVANYNVAHSQELGGGIKLDTCYLLALGPHAIPALDRIIAHRGEKTPPALIYRRMGLADAHLARMRDWRLWTWNDWRLASYLRGNPTPARAAGAT